VGVRPVGIERFRRDMEDYAKLRTGGSVDELSDDAKRELAARADAELTGVDLLADIVEAHRKRP
jgi:hypothetical protein